MVPRNVAAMIHRHKQRNEHNLCGNTKPASDMSFRRSRQRSGGIHPSCGNNLRKVKLATWEDPSTPFHFGRDDISGWFRFVPTGYIGGVSGTAHRPFPTVSLIGGLFIQRISKPVTSVHNNCQLSTVNCQLIQIVNFPALPSGLVGGWFRLTRGNLCDLNRRENTQ